ncbi:hypothetical protein Bca101_008681 [Brassica carinata]
MSSQFRRDRSRFHPQQTWVPRVTLVLLLHVLFICKGSITVLVSTKGIMWLALLHLIAKELHLGPGL